MSNSEKYELMNYSLFGKSVSKNLSKDKNDKKRFRDYHRRSRSYGNQLTKFSVENNSSFHGRLGFNDSKFSGKVAGGGAGGPAGGDIGKERKRNRHQFLQKLRKIWSFANLPKFPSSLL